MKLGRRIAIIITALALVAMACPALAMPVNLGAQPMIIPTVSVADGSTVSMILNEFQLLGTNENGDYLIFANQGFYSVDPGSMGPLLAALSVNPASLPSITSLQSLSRGSKGAGVQTLQSALQALGYLSGAVDGDFGPGTEGALVAFQAAIGAKQNGIASPMQQMLAMSMANMTAPQGAAQPQQGDATAQPVPVESAPDTSIQAQYAVIADRTDADLQPIYDAGLALEYDDIAGKGFISDGTVMRYDLSEGIDIGKYQLTVQFGLLVQDGKDGKVAIDPAARITCLCIQRPVLNELLLKSGTARSTCAISDLTSTLQGVYSLESGVAKLDDAAVEALLGASENGELKLRINGRYKSFDIQVGGEYIASVSKLGMIAQQIKP